jgi:uncharacterized protein involved in exopolysaccharide biosynthesis
MEETAILDVLRRRVWMIVTIGLVATAVGYGGSFLQARKYTATALVLVRPQEAIKLQAGSSSSKEFLDFPIAQSTTVETPSKTYIEIIKSPALIGQLVNKLSLDKGEEASRGTFTKFLPAFMKPGIDSLKNFLNDAIKLLTYGTVIPKDPFADAVKMVQENLVLEARTDTYIFSVKYTSNSPRMAADVANTAANLFIDFMEQIRLAEGKSVVDRLQSQLEETQRGLEGAQRQYEAFKNTHSTFLYKAEYDAQLNVISKLQSDLAKADEALAAFNAVGRQNSVSNAILKERRDSILRTLQAKQEAVASLPKIEREVKQLELAEKVALTAYESVEKVVKEAEIKNSYAAREVLLVSDAVPPHLPSGPARMLIALASLLSGIGLGVGLAFLLEYLNRAIRSIRDVEDYVGVKVLATIPRISSTGSRGTDP